MNPLGNPNQIMGKQSQNKDLYWMADYLNETERKAEEAKGRYADLQIYKTW